MMGEDLLVADRGAPAVGPASDALAASAAQRSDSRAGLTAPGDVRHAGKRGRRRKKRRSAYARDHREAAAGATISADAPPSPAILVADSYVARPAPSERYYAALDLGTNNCRLLVATPKERGFRVVDAFSRIVRLGEGVGANRVLSEAAMDRAVDALRICGAKLAQRNVARARLIATEACRAAGNGRAFVERVQAETGLELEIVSQETEARLAVAGCASLIDPTSSGAILFDIGGGSSELVWIDLRQPPGARRRRIADRVRSWVSLPVGVVTLSERHGGVDVTRACFEAMVAEVAALLEAFPEGPMLDAAVRDGGVHMLGTSGTVTTLAGIHLGLPRYDRRQVDGIWMRDEDVGAMMEQLVSADFEARVAHPCIGRDRADLVLAGCAILEAFRRRWPCPRLRVADRGLREGILVEMMSADGVWRRDGDRRGGGDRGSSAP